MKSFREIISYLFWGGVTTAVNWIVYVVLVGVLSVAPATGNAAAWIFAVAAAYISNKVFVFKNNDRKNIKKELTLFLSSRLFSGAVEVLGLPLMISTLSWGSLYGIEGFREKLLLSVIVVVLNYVFSKYIIFKK